MHIWMALAMTLVSVIGCAALHKTQIGEIDNRAALSLTPFELKMSETGFDLQQVAAAGRLFKRNTVAAGVGKLAAIVSLFQMGPRTGIPVYSDHYADDLLQALRTQCPNGGLTGLMSVRETRKYPVISGEIVKIRGYCAHTKHADLNTPKLYAESRP